MSNSWEWVQVPGGPKVYTSVTPEEAAALGRLAAGRDVLEVGSAFGYSAIMMARAARSVTAVDSHLPHPDNGMAEGSYGVMLGNLRAAGVHQVVTVLRQPAEEALPALHAQGRRFGLVFIDGDHAYESVLHDAGQARRLVTDDGHIACHDYGHGEPGSASCGIGDVNRALDETFPLGPDEITGTLHVTRGGVPL